MLENLFIFKPSRKKYLLTFISGANSGIGYETVVALASASPDFHILLGSRSEEKGQKAVEEIKSANPSLKGTISTLQIDIVDQSSVAAAKSKVEADFGKLDILINNAGILVYQPDIDVLSALRKSFETNVFAQLLVTEAFEPLLKKSSKPYVVYVSSGMGSITIRLDPNAPFRQLRGEPYRMSKAALNMLAACHRYNFSEWGCKVAAFDPGWCVSNLTGEKGREMRVKGGARDAKEPAATLTSIALGQKDEELEKNGLLDVDGKILPW